MSVMFHLSPSLRPPLKRGFLVCTPTALLSLHTVHASSGTRESLAVTTMSDFSTRLIWDTGVAGCNYDVRFLQGRDRQTDRETGGEGRGSLSQCTTRLIWDTGVAGCNTDVRFLQGGETDRQTERPVGWRGIFCPSVRHVSSGTRESLAVTTMSDFSKEEKQTDRQTERPVGWGGVVCPSVRHVSSGTRESLAVTTMSDFSTRLIWDTGVAGCNNDVRFLHTSRLGHGGQRRRPASGVKPRRKCEQHTGQRSVTPVVATDARFGDWGRGGGSG